MNMFKNKQQATCPQQKAEYVGVVKNTHSAVYRHTHTVLLYAHA